MRIVKTKPPRVLSRDHRHIIQIFSSKPGIGLGGRRLSAPSPTANCMFHARRVGLSQTAFSLYYHTAATCDEAFRVDECLVTTGFPSPNSFPWSWLMAGKTGGQRLTMGLLVGNILVLFRRSLQASSLIFSSKHRRFPEEET